MGVVSRGFSGRRRDGPPTACRPASTSTRDFPVLSAGPTPRTSLERLGLHDRRRGRRAASLDVGRVPRAAERDDHRRHPLRDQVVQARHRLGGRLASTRCSTASRPTAEYVIAFCDGGYTTNLPLADVTGGKAWVAFEYDGEPLEPEHGGPARLLVPHLYFWKSAKWVRGLRSARRGRAGLLGDARLPQLRRPMAGAAVLGRLTLASPADGRRAPSPRRRASKTLVLDVPGWPGHRAGQHVDVRLTAEDGYQAQRSYSIASAPDAGRRRADGRAARRRRGVAVPDRASCGRATSSSCAGRSAATSSGTPTTAGRCCSSAAAPGIVPLMAMIRQRAAHGERRADTAPLLLAHAGTTSSTARSSSGRRRRRSTWSTR